MLNINIMKNYLYLFLLVMFFPFTIQSQTDYQPLYSLSDYNYLIIGELELEFSNSVNFLELSSRHEGFYIIKTPIVVMFNLNDLKFFKADPLAYLGNEYDEVLVSTPLYPLTYLPENSLMQVDAHFKSWEYDQLTEIKAKGKLSPILQIEFNHVTFTSALSKNQELTFRINIFGVSDSFTQQTEVSGYGKMGDFTITEGFQIPLSIGCGTFFSFDLSEALILNQANLQDNQSQNQFETEFNKNYFKDLPEIPAMPLIDFLINPFQFFLRQRNGTI